MEPRLLNGNWIGVSDADDRARGLFDRHYSRHRYKDGRKPLKFTGPGETMVLMTINCMALFVWRRFIESGQEKPNGVNCAVFRNETPILSSDLITEADDMAWGRWTGERLYTYVSSKDIRSTHPGYCFLQSGWDYVRDAKGKPMLTKKRGLHILEIYPPIGSNHGLKT